MIQKLYEPDFRSDLSFYASHVSRTIEESLNGFIIGYVYNSVEDPVRISVAASVENSIKSSVPFRYENS